ncbi:hypothetical protein BC829DRAFT_390334 [Chytridium lagenaria]|nr:hypothetical protein BC829DRAFT_390334 [Chytridium lagenaria]
MDEGSGIDVLNVPEAFRNREVSPLWPSISILIEIMRVQLMMIGSCLASVGPGAFLSWIVFISLDAFSEVEFERFQKFSLALELNNIFFFTLRIRGIVGVPLHMGTSALALFTIEIATILIFSAYARRWVRVASIIGLFVASWAGITIWHLVFIGRTTVAKTLEKNGPDLHKKAAQAWTRRSISGPDSSHQEVESMGLGKLFVAYIAFIASVNVIPVIAIQFSIKSFAVLVVANCLLPLFQIFLGSLATAETERAIKISLLLSFQFPPKFLRFYMSNDPSAVKNRHSNFWISLFLQVLMERAIPRIASALEQRVSPEPDSVSSHISTSDEKIVPEQRQVKFRLGQSSGNISLHPLHEESDLDQNVKSAATLPTIQGSTQNVGAADALFEAVIKVSMVYSTSRNDLTLSNYISTLTGMICVLLPHPHDGTWSDMAVSHGLRHDISFVDGVNESLVRLKWQETLWHGMLFLVLEFVFENLFVFWESRYGVPVGSSERVSWIEATTNCRLAMNYMAAYAGVLQLFKIL